MNKKDADEISSTFYGSFGLLTFAVFDAGSSGLISLWFTLSPHCTRPQRNFRMANSALRLIFHRSSRLIFSAGSTNGLIPSRSQEVNISLKRKLSSFLNSNPFVQASCHRATTSLVCTCRKVIQGDVRPTLCHKELGFRSYSSFEQGCTQNLSTDKAEKGSGMGDIDASGVTVPNDTWTVESLKLLKKLTSDLIAHGNGNWSKHKSSLYNGERRLFTKAMVTEYPGKFFEYEFFFSTKDQRLKGVIQFGPYTQGPPGCVHGGASASMMDAAVGVLVNKTFPFCVTASLTMNYKSLLPLGSTALVESWIDKVEGRKIFACAELKSPDGKLTYVTANALFIQLDPQGKK